MTSIDRIEKEIVLRASRGRVWRALTDTAEFNAWFNVKLEGAFAVGKSVRGPLMIKGYTHVTMEVIVEAMEAERRFAYRWHPYAVDPKVDYSGEPMTLVEFRLDDVPGGTKLSVVESGFDQLPAHQHDKTFHMNDANWKAQLENVRKYVEV